MNAPSVAKRAEATIQYFEERGRIVSGVTIKGAEIKVEFETAPLKNAEESVDLVRMG